MIIDISNYQNPVLLDSYNTPSHAYYSVFVSNNIAYVADGESGLQVIDVSNPTAPVLLNTILPHPTSRINKCIISNNLLIISDNNWNELYFYNISNPAVRLCLQKWCKIGKAEGEKG